MIFCVHVHPWRMQWLLHLLRISSTPNKRRSPCSLSIILKPCQNSLIASISCFRARTHIHFRPKVGESVVSDNRSILRKMRLRVGCQWPRGYCMPVASRFIFRARIWILFKQRMTRPIYWILGLLGKFNLVSTPSSRHILYQEKKVTVYKTTNVICYRMCRNSVTITGCLSQTFLFVVLTIMKNSVFFNSLSK